MGRGRGGSTPAEGFGSQASSAPRGPSQPQQDSKAETPPPTCAAPVPRVPFSPRHPPAGVGWRDPNTLRANPALPVLRPQQASASLTRRGDCPGEIDAGSSQPVLPWAGSSWAKHTDADTHRHTHTQHRDADPGGCTHTSTPISYPETHQGTHSLQTSWRNTNAQTGTRWALTGHPHRHIPCRPAAHTHTSPPAREDQGPPCLTQAHGWPGPAASSQGCPGIATSLSSAPCHCPGWRSLSMAPGPLSRPGPPVCSSVQMMSRDVKHLFCIRRYGCGGEHVTGPRGRGQVCPRPSEGSRPGARGHERKHWQVVGQGLCLGFS